MAIVLFDNGILVTNALDERTANILLSATDRGTAPIQPSDILFAAIAAQDRQILTAITMALEDGALPSHIQELIEVHNPANTTGAEFDGLRERFSPNTLRALDEFDAAVSADREHLRGVCLELLMASVFGHLDLELTILDTDRAVGVLHKQVAISTGAPLNLFDSGTGRLRSEQFAESAWVVLEHACVNAAELGYERVLPPHCLLALLGETEGLTERLIRLQVSPELGPAKVSAAVSNGIRLSDRKRQALQPCREDFGEALVAMLRLAGDIARTWGMDRIESQHLLAALLDDPPARLVAILEREPLRIDLARIRRQLDQELRDKPDGLPLETAFRLPGGLLPAEDLTFAARTTGIPPARRLDAYFDTVAKAMFRKTNNHVLITGQSGVGRTTLVRELARRASTGEIPFLRHKRFLWVDGRDVSAAESGAKLVALIAHTSTRTDLVLCVDGLGPLLRAESGRDHKLYLRAALKEQQVQLVGVMDTTDYEQLLAADHRLLALLTRVDLSEPDREAAIDIAQQVAEKLGEEFEVVIEPRAVERAVALSADYILSDRLPGKAAKILRRACEDLDYERAQHGSDRKSVEVEDVVTVVSEISGVPESQLSGVGVEGMDYELALTEDVVGQSEAVAAVAEELRLIKFGLRSGSVMFFAGQTGVGKSELAKALARFYSASKRLQIYTMGNFVEPHSVSGIIGSPSGYIGHDRGGRLINDLTADPYCVVVLDEAEKAHPDVWKPFLNLFEEGWIDDQRGVRAYGDRAIFILTSNAGADRITELVQQGRSMAEISAAVKDHLPTLRHEHSRQPVFPPEFLARIRRIIVFKPLDRAAMTGICRKMLAKRERFWSEKREKRLVIPEALIDYIADVCDAQNRASGGREGGRIVDKKIAELVEDAIVREAKRQQDSYLACRCIELEFEPPRRSEEPRVEVLFRVADRPVAVLE